MKYHYAIKNLGADHNIKLYVDAVDAYAELDRREGYGVPCEIQSRQAWDADVMRHATDNLPEEQSDE